LDAWAEQAPTVIQNQDGDMDYPIGF